MSLSGFRFLMSFEFNVLYYHGLTQLNQTLSSLAKAAVGRMTSQAAVTRL